MYIVYADSIFILCMVLQSSILFLVNQRLFKIAEPGKIWLASVLSAVISILPYCSPGKLWLKNVVFNSVCTLFVLLYLFQMKTLKSVWMVLACYGKTLLWFGAVVGIGIKCGRALHMKMGLLYLIGCLIVAFLSDQLWICKKEKESMKCRVILVKGQKQVEVEAFIDTGNGLVEPISQKPVCIVEQKVGESLFQKNDITYRVVPYHSIGKRRGYLPGFLLPELKIQRNGLEKSVRDVYVAICDEQLESRVGGQIKMLLNPKILTGE